MKKTPFLQILICLVTNIHDRRIHSHYTINYTQKVYLLDLGGLLDGLLGGLALSFGAKTESFLESGFDILSFLQELLELSLVELFPLLAEFSPGD